MTSTERSRRHRRLHADKPATKLPGKDAIRWQAEIAALKARIRALERELRERHSARPPRIRGLKLKRTETY
jgi:hypothetical protein